jgi:hypothetical protein
MFAITVTTGLPFAADFMMILQLRQRQTSLTSIFPRGSTDRMLAGEALTDGEKEEVRDMIELGTTPKRRQ